jgi:D-serine deaminase-like pyridoxal phosphate-dependent protein
MGKQASVVIKLETGGNRLGVHPSEPMLNLARQIEKLPGVTFRGVYAHEVYSGPTMEGADKEALKVADIAMEAARSLRKVGIAIDHVSVGASPTFRAACKYLKEGKFKEITEIHPGKLALDDIAQAMMLDAQGLRRVATVLTTVVSTSHSDHAVIDAGFKTFGFDALIGYRDRPDFFWRGKPSYGKVKGRPDLWLGALHAEVGRVFYKDDSKKVNLGERLEILPNNTTLVIHINKKMYGVRNGKVEVVVPVTGYDSVQ